MHTIAQLACCAGVIACGLLAGCEGRPSLLPNSDPALNKTSTQFAADAAKRFPYPFDADKAGKADGRVAIDLNLGKLQILNYSTEDWKNIDIWVNQGYVCHLPIISHTKDKVETLDFEMLYNSQGHYFGTRNGQNPVQQVEMVKDGKVYEIPLALAD